MDEIIDIGKCPEPVMIAAPAPAWLRFTVPAPLSVTPFIVTYVLLADGVDVD